MIITVSQETRCKYVMVLDGCCRRKRTQLACLIGDGDTDIGEPGAAPKLAVLEKENDATCYWQETMRSAKYQNQSPVFNFAQFELLLNDVVGDKNKKSWKQRATIFIWRKLTGISISWTKLCHSLLTETPYSFNWDLVAEFDIQGLMGVSSTMACIYFTL